MSGFYSLLPVLFLASSFYSLSCAESVLLKLSHNGNNGLVLVLVLFSSGLLEAFATELLTPLASIATLSPWVFG